MQTPSPAAASCSNCGHPVEEHRAEVLPFSVCRHVDYREHPYGGAAFSFAGVATPCACTEVKT